jgi:hypothetical protein
MPVVNVSPDVKVSEPKISKFFLLIIKILSKPYLYILLGFAKIILRGDMILFDAFKRALAGESRCIIAFRHPDGREPQLLTWFFIYRLKKLARKKKVRFCQRPHAIFVYGYEVARWGGPIARLFMPKVGAIPIHHTKLDSKGMARIYKAVTDGPYPLALAPEGQVSYSSDTLPRLEAGTVRIGFQSAVQLAEKNISAPVEILPLSIHFRYDRHGRSAMYKLLKKIEKICGFTRKDTKDLNFQERLKNCRECVIALNEKRYNIKTEESDTFETRLDRVVNAALETAERMLGIKGEGEYFPRLYKVRHECWDKIFVPGVTKIEHITKLQRSVMDIGAGEAWHIARHQELADFGWYFRHPLPEEDTALHQKIEYVQNLWDFANRTMGGALANRVNIKPKKVILQAAPPINLTAKLGEYKENKKETINSVVAQLEKAYMDCIKEVNAEVPG